MLIFYKQGHYLIWQLSAVTSCSLNYCINCSHLKESCGREVQRAAVGWHEHPVLQEIVRVLHPFKQQNGTYTSKCIQMSYCVAVCSVMYLAVHIYSMFTTQTWERCSRPYGVAHISSFPQNGWKMLYHCRRPAHPHLHSQAENKVVNNWICLTGFNTFYKSYKPCLYTSLFHMSGSSRLRSPQWLCTLIVL